MSEDPTFPFLLLLVFFKVTTVRASYRGGSAERLSPLFTIAPPALLRVTIFACNVYAYLPTVLDQAGQFQILGVVPGSQRHVPGMQRSCPGSPGQYHAPQTSWIQWDNPGYQGHYMHIIPGSVLCFNCLRILRTRRQLKTTAEQGADGSVGERGEVSFVFYFIVTYGELYLPIWGLTYLPNWGPTFLPLWDPT